MARKSQGDLSLLCEPQPGRSGHVYRLGNEGLCALIVATIRGSIEGWPRFILVPNICLQGLI